ncbi:MAG: TonB-dependent receptor plug domain-containing protein, partial [Alphaproteobacteria bacterium]|nr:TonB-dependent receptor plug domain-containing protein [Alphaproteobacteria bacterium]
MAHAQQQQQSGAAQAKPQTDPSEQKEIVVTGRFINTGASSATKLNVRVLDTPFSIAAYNNNFLKAIETTNVSDLYRYMNGIQRAGNTSYDITFRGFKTSANDRNAILTDGLPGLTVRFGSPPTIGVDHVELVKGPSSVLYGQAQPGGFINIISKKPLDVPQFTFGLTGMAGAGSYNRDQGELVSLDMTGPVTKDGSVTARLVAEGQYTDG